MNKYRSPNMALLWSLAIPGLGQLYNGDYLVGLTLMILELVINVNTDLNLAILYSFRAQLGLASQIVNHQWLLFYPCVYSFSVWHAYNKAIEINHTDGKAGEDHSKTVYNGVFLGAAMGGTLGVIYPYGLGPVFAGLIGMCAGAFIGSVFEYFVNRK